MNKLLLTILILISLVSVHAEDMVVVNSDNWQDVYTGSVYANILDVPVKFVTDFEQGLTVLNLVPEGVSEVLIIQSDVIIDSLPSRLEDNGYTVEVLEGDETEINLELLERSGVDKVAIMDDSFGHNAIAIGGYLVASDRMPVFVDRGNVDEVSLEGFKALVYGKVDSIVKEEFDDQISEIINEGDKFSNNFEVLKRHLKLENRGQILLTDGSFIEAELLQGQDPVVLVGASNVPDEVIDAIKDAEVTAGVAIGTSIVKNAQEIKNKADLQVYVKFAQGRNEEQFPLDTFPIPSTEFLLSVDNAIYNTGSNNLEVTFTNAGDNFLVFKGDYFVLLDDSQIEALSDDDGVFIPSEGTVTTSYDVDLNSYSEESLILDYKVLMGEEVTALEAILEGKEQIHFKEFKDESKIEIVTVEYDDKTKRFDVQVENLVSEEAFYRAEIELLIDEEKEIFSSSQLSLEPNGKGSAEIRAVLEEVDIADNPNFDVTVHYGARENSLIKQVTKNLEFVIKSSSILIWVIVIIVLLLLILFTFTRKKKKKR